MFNVKPQEIATEQITAIPGLPFKFEISKKHLTTIFITKLSLFAL